MASIPQACWISRSAQLTALTAGLCLSACNGVAIRGGTGTFEYTTDGSNFGGETDTSYYGVELLRADDSPAEVSFRYERWGVSDDLFSEAGFDNVETDLSIVTLTSVFDWLERGALELNGIVGLSYMDLNVEDRTAELSWNSLGIDLGMAPYVSLVRGPKGELGLFGEFVYTIGQAGVDLAGDTSVTDDGTTVIQSYAVGLRYQRGAVSLSGGVQSRAINIDSIDLSSGLQSREIDHNVSSTFFSLETSF